MAIPRADVTAEMTARLSAAGDPDRAVKERAYLKSEREFYGCSVPVVRRVVRDAAGEFELTTRDRVEPVAAELWAGEPFEHRAAAVELWALRHRLLDPGDLTWLQDWIAAGETWAIVDKLSTDVIGRIIEREPEACEPVLDRWSTDESFWVRRASMLALLTPLRRSDDRWPQFCRYAESMLDEREFFIRKVIGWVVRDVSRRRPDTARPWVEAHLDQMSGVTRREALKYLSFDRSS